MALDLADRVLTIAVTATLTSAAWIVVGTSYVGAPEDTVPTPAPTPAAAAAAPEAVPDDHAPGTLLIPVQGIAAAQLRDSFGDERGERQHEALDIMAPTGSPVVAAAAGKVEKLFVSDAGGNTVYVRSPDRRTLHYYAHLQEYEPGLREGQAVERGQRLGTVGSTGNADPAAPHLHFAILRIDSDAEWWEPGTPVNPYALLAGR